MFQLDENQQELESEFDQFRLFLNKKTGFFAKFFKSNQEFEYCGLYIHSKPGRGKTMLMKNFYDQVNIAKSYFHFNDFMYQVHKNKHKTRRDKSKAQYSNQDLLISLKKVTKGSKLICFDEFQVNDIADAMILERIFTYFIENKIFLVITSNAEPSKLYPNGLQREIFMGFVNSQIIEKFKIIHFNSKVDYRLIHKKNIEQRYFLTKNEEKEFDSLMLNSVDGKKPASRSLKIWGRAVEVDQTVGNIAIFEYADLCQGNLSASDYRVICGEFDLIFLKNLPKFCSESRNEIKRFMLFIDEIYENKTALIILAEVEIENLYHDENDKEINARVVSRLNEIKSDLYFNNSKYIKNDI